MQQEGGGVAPVGVLEEGKREVGEHAASAVRLSGPLPPGRVHQMALQRPRAGVALHNAAVPVWTPSTLVEAEAVHGTGGASTAAARAARSMR